MFKAAAVVSDTKRVLKNLDGQGLAELRALQKPDNEIEDLLAAIIIIGEHGKLWFSVGASVPLAKMNMTQQLACVQTPCILVDNDLHTRIYPATIRNYCFLQESLKILS